MLGSVVHGLAGTSPPPPSLPDSRTDRAGTPRKIPRPFVVDRNICSFLWYGEGAGEGLRSVGADGELPIQERMLYPAPRSPFTGRGSLQWVNPAPWLAAKASGGPIGTAPKRSPGRLPPPAPRVPRRA